MVQGRSQYLLEEIDRLMILRQALGAIVPVALVNLMALMVALTDQAELADLLVMLMVAIVNPVGLALAILVIPIGLAGLPIDRMILIVALAAPKGIITNLNLADLAAHPVAPSVRKALIASLLKNHFFKSSQHWQPVRRSPWWQLVLAN
jgi:hypothetical protein